MTNKTHKGLEVTHSLVTGVSFALVVGSIGVLLFTSSRSEDSEVPSLPVVQYQETEQQEVVREYAFRISQASAEQLSGIQRDISNEIAQTEDAALVTDLKALEVDVCLRLADSECIEARLIEYEQGSPEHSSLTEELAQIYIENGNTDRARELIQALIDALPETSDSDEPRAYYEAQLEVLQ